MDNQTTLKKSVEFSGVGLHTGDMVKMIVDPAPPDHGIRFSYFGRVIRASISNIGTTARNTGLTDGTATLRTVEHVLSALMGIGIDNALITMDASEPPAMDGSALEFAGAFYEAGVADTGAPARFMEMAAAQPVVVKKDDSYFTWIPGPKFEAIYVLEYEHLLVGRQAVRFAGGAGKYLDEIAPARTFGFIEEVEKLRQAGLALGGAEDNAVVIYPDRLSRDLRFPDEFARHKLLDLIGDIRLLFNVRPTGCFIGIKSGHSLNAEAVLAIAESVSL